MTATPPPPTASSCVSSGRGRTWVTTVAVDGGAAEDFGADPGRLRRRRRRSAPTATPPTCPTPAALDLPAGDDGPGAPRGHAGRAGRPADRQRGLRPDPIRRADAVARAGCWCSRPSWPGPARGGRRRSRRSNAAPHGSCSTTAPNARRSVTNRPYLTPDHPGAGRRRARLHRAARARLRLRRSGGCSRPTARRTAPSRRRTPGRPRPDAVGGDVQVGAFNVLNYFLTLTGPDARGASSPAEFERAGRQDRAGDRGARTPTS